MKTDTLSAKKLMLEGGYTGVLIHGNQVITSKERGVKPLLQWLNDENDYKGFCASDKVVGKAAAFLYVALGVDEVSAEVISEPAIDVFSRYGINCYYGTAVKAIFNRDNTGLCPMEAAVKDISDTESAVCAIKEKIAVLNKIKD